MDTPDDPLDSLTPKQAKALAELLVQPTVEKAAEAAGVSARSVRRWMREPGFSEAFRRARRDTLAQGLGLVAASVGAAGMVLRSIMLEKSSGPAVRARAAASLISAATSGYKVTELDEELLLLRDAVERERKAKKRNRT